MAALLHKLLAGRRQGQVALAEAVPREYLARLVDTFEQAGLPIRPAVGRGVVVAGLIEPLTAREAEVLGLLAAGRSNRDIAEALCLSPRTVQRHVANAYLKIGAHNKAEATAYALRHGLA
jgi:LuxR family transcriptional regulator, maltose regulon positive regulatory protein